MPERRGEALAKQLAETQDLRLPPERVEQLADFVDHLNRVTLDAAMGHEVLGDPARYYVALVETASRPTRRK